MSGGRKCNPAALLRLVALLAVLCGQAAMAQRRYGYQSCPSGCVCLIATVRCTHRRLESFPNIPRDTRTLDLRFNKISVIPPNTFRGLRKINTMLLNNNLLKTIEQDAFKGLSQLKYLYLYKNGITTVHKFGFRGLDSLEHLYLYDNKLETIHPMTFQNVPKLQRLFLYGNRLTTLPSVLFNNLNHLRHIRVDSNPLKCDCHLAWFARYLRSSRGRGIHASATCFSPQAVAGQAIASLREDAFTCPEGEPIIILNPEDVEARQRYSVRLTCRASGHPQPRISWTRNGVQIQPDSRVRVLSDGTLSIQVPRDSDQGTYVCVARNSAGEVRSEPARVTYVGVNGPPVFRVTPSDAEVMIGDHVTFHCRAVGNPEPVTRWYRNGERLPVLPNYIIMPQTLHIREVGLEDNGTFTCVVANSEGKANSSAQLLVRSPPKFTVPPQDKSSIQGRSATLDCHAEGIPTPSITWLKDRRPLNRDQRYLLMSTGSLLIRALSSGDEGRYTCRASSKAGVIAGDAYLTVIVPPHFTVRPQNQRVRQGTTVDFQCQVAGRPQPHIVWTVNGRAVPDDPRYNLLPSGTLRLLRAQPDDAGTFRCEGANSVGAQHAQVTLTVIPHTPLVFARSPTDQEVKSGANVHIACTVTGGGAGERGTEIYWLKDGVRLVTTSGRYFITAAPSSVLTIFRAGRDDSGRYECRAQSGIDMITASMTLKVVIESSVNDIVASLSNILPPNCLRHGCTGELMEGEHPQSPGLNQIFHHFVEPHPHRSKRQSDVGSLVSLAELEDSVSFATSLVNRGINETVAHFNDRRNRQTAGDLLNLMRFPSSQEGVDLTKAAEVFDVSLRMIECCVRRGMRLKKFALPKQKAEADVSPSSRASLAADESEVSEDFDIGPIIGTEVVELVANLSGCSGHQAIPDCSSNICFHRKYRTADGTCNNLHFPLWGASLTPFHRLLQPIYENGFNAPVAWNPERRYNNHSLPSPREVSVAVLMSAGSRPPRQDPDFTHMVMQWGQFVDHDLDFTTMAPSIQRFSDGQACRDSCEREGPCFPIGVDGNDPRHGRFHHHQHASSPLRRGHHRHSSSPSSPSSSSSSCMEFTRSSAVCGTGITSVFFSAISRREQINQITSYLDASNVYGSTENDTNNLRQLANEFGLLKEGQPLEVGQKPLLPYNVFSDLNAIGNFIRPVAPIECRRGDGETARQRSVPCFLAGDLRANEQVSLTAMHTMWMREHNRIARYLRQANRHWDGDTIFHESRKIVGALMQHITYTQWLPKLLGPFMDNIGPYKGYDPNMPSSIVNVFATAAYRFGHTMINPIMYRLNETWHETGNGNLMLHEAFFAPFRIVHEGGIEPLVRGLIAKPMKARDSDSNMNSELIERLFAMAEEVALDLGALNIQRGRDHGLPFYSDWRQFCNLSRADTFDDLANEIKNPEVRTKLKDLYKVTSNIDPFVGMIVEDIVPGSRLGPTLGCLLSEQFKRTRDGDRFWYENPAIFSPIQVSAIKQASLARIICDNTDSINQVPRDVFLNQPTSDFVSCDEIPSIDLSAWVDCCRDCGDSGSFETLSEHVRSRARSKRSSESTPFSYESENHDRKMSLDASSLNVTSTPPRVETHADAPSKIEHLTFNKDPQPERGSKMQEEAYDKLTALVERLEKEVGRLQAEVHRLEGRLESRDTD